jgi:hypothetical protein
VELSQLLPIGTFIDHGSVLPEAEARVAGTLDAFAAYAAVRAKGGTWSRRLATAFR